MTTAAEIETLRQKADSLSAQAAAEKARAEMLEEQRAQAWREVCEMMGLAVSASREEVAAGLAQLDREAQELESQIRALLEGSA